MHAVKNTGYIKSQLRYANYNPYGINICPLYSQLV